MNEKHLQAGLVTSTHARTGLSLLLLVFGATVFFLAGARSEALGAQPRGRQAGVRQAESRPVRADHAISRIRIDTPEGVFLVYNSAMPPNTDQPSRAGRRGAGFLAYWNDLGTRQAARQAGSTGSTAGQLYVFDRVLYTRADVGQALLNLEMDLAIDVLAIATADAELTQAVEFAVAEPQDATTWTTATRGTIRSVMGFPEDDPVAAAAPPDPDAKCCLMDEQCCGGVGAGVGVSRPAAPSFGAKPATLIVSTMQALVCCPTGTPRPHRPHPPPPPPCGDASCGCDRCCAGSSCCGSTDPCCDSNDSCCGNSNRCCNPDNPCCGSSDPCCDPSDPCCGSSDRSCNEDNPCAGSPDPCCDSNDPCCGDSNRCCNSDNPCCGSDDPCCNSSDPCCGDSDRCCNPDNQCCGSDDPCCDSNDPCCGNPDPCCNPDNPDCGGCTVACCNSADPGCNDPCLNNPDPCCGDPDPCCGNPDPCCPVTDPCDAECGDPCSPGCLDCDDGDPCTIDSCSGGSCVNEPACAPDVLCCEGACCSAAASSASAQASCDEPPPIICCPANACCAGVCINSGTQCCPDGKGCPAPAPGQGEICCGARDSCASKSATGCCPPGGTVRPDGQCCFDGNGCTTDGYECADSFTPCQSYNCIFTPACDDGNPCTDDPCTADSCGNPVCGTPTNKPDCTACPNGVCQNGVCQAPSATLTLNPSSIPAKTEWGGMPAWYVSDISVTWNPPECEGTLTIVDVVGDNGYTPPNQGTLAPIDARKWRYTAFDEPKAQKHPERVTVWIAAMKGTQELTRIPVVVRSVFEWWKSTHKHVPGGILHTPTTSDYLNAVDFITWKYASCFPAGGAFSSVSIASTATVSCRIDWFTWVDAAACTDNDTRAVVFGRSTFTRGENIAASVIGHELFHTVGADECDALTWELDHSICTSIDAAYLNQTLLDKIDVCGQS